MRLHALLGRIQSPPRKGVSARRWPVERPVQPFSCGGAQRRSGGGGRGGVFSGTEVAARGRCSGTVRGLALRRRGGAARGGRRAALRARGGVRGGTGGARRCSGVHRCLGSKRLRGNANAATHARRVTQKRDQRVLGSPSGSAGAAAAVLRGSGSTCTPLRALTPPSRQGGSLAAARRSSSRRLAPAARRIARGSCIAHACARVRARLAAASASAQFCAVPQTNPTARARSGAARRLTGHNGEDQYRAGGGGARDPARHRAAGHTAVRSAKQRRRRARRCVRRDPEGLGRRCRDAHTRTRARMRVCGARVSARCDVARGRAARERSNAALERCSVRAAPLSRQQTRAATRLDI
jgi:hypothetical protein